MRTPRRKGKADGRMERQNDLMMTKGQVACVDLESGKVLWQGPGRAGENASLVVAGEHILVLSNEAVLTVLAASSTEHKVIAAYTVAPSPTWAHLAVSGNRILVKDKDTLRCLKF